MIYECTVLFFVFFVASCDCLVYKSNVCKSFQDYATISENKNCWYNPDVGSSPKLIAKRLGYPFEKHTIITEDGYYLTAYRIPRGVQHNEHSLKSRAPVLIQHGAAGSSAFWMLQGNRSLAFVLADSGYDVWLLNARGTYYSTKHKYLNMNQPEYWNFGFHEMAVYDLPACIDFIANKTSQKGNLIYIGHSMGTTISYIYSITKKQHADENLKGLISLAPVAYMKNIKGGFKLLAPNFNSMSKLIRSSGLEAVGQFHQLQNLILRLTCGHFPFIITCNSILELFSGISPEQLQPEIVPVFLSFYPSGMSLKTLGHFVQLITTGEFRHYDHGPRKNLLVYNQRIPPEYDTNTISLPVYLFVGEHDVVGDIQDAHILRDRINAGKPNLQASIYTFPLAHNDFFLGKDLTGFYTKLLNALNLLSVGKTNK